MKEPRWSLAGPETVPEAYRSPVRRLAPLTVMCANCCAAVQYIVATDFARLELSPPAVCGLLIELLFLIDVQIGTVGYLMTLKPLDAQSEPARTRVNQWLHSTLMSRLDNKQTGVIIVVMQRVHMDDLCGFLTSSSSEWEVLSLPAIAEIAGARQEASSRSRSASRGCRGHSRSGAR